MGVENTGLKVKLEGPAAVEERRIIGLSDLKPVINDFLSGHIDRVTISSGKPIDLVKVIGEEDIYSQILPEAAGILSRNKGSVEMLVSRLGVYGICVIAAAVALGRANYEAGPTALEKTAKALADFGARPAQLALKNAMSAAGIYDAAKAAAGGRSYVPR